MTGGRAPGTGASAPGTLYPVNDERTSYDVWGAAVNTASRMESHGAPGRIQVSEAFRELAGDAFVFEERGEIDIRGVGLTRTCFLLRERAA